MMPTATKPQNSGALLNLLSTPGHEFVMDVAEWRAATAQPRPVNPKAVWDAKRRLAVNLIHGGTEEDREVAVNGLLSLVAIDPRIALDRHPYRQADEQEWWSLVELAQGYRPMHYDLLLAPMLAGLVGGDATLQRSVRGQLVEGPTWLEWLLRPQAEDTDVAKAICAHYGVALPASHHILMQFGRIWRQIPADEKATALIVLRSDLAKDVAQGCDINLHRIIPGAPSPLSHIVGCSSWVSLAVMEALLDAGADPTAQVWTEATGRVPLINALLTAAPEHFAPRMALRLIERHPEVIDQIPDFNATAIATRDAWRERGTNNPVAVRSARDLDALRMIRAQTRSTKQLAAKPRTTRVF